MTAPTGSPVAAGTCGLDVRLVVHRDDGFVLDLSLHAPRGSTTALLGPNGAGKSTALAAIAGLRPLDAGHVAMDGQVLDDPSGDVFVPPAARGVGVVFQDGLLFDHLSVRDNVAFGPRSAGASRTEARAVASRWLTELEVEHLADRRPPTLSGGQAQRVALARTLAADPGVVLLDEPMSALDVQGRASLRRTLATHLARLDAPRLLVTHDPVEAFLLADRVAVLEHGRLTQLGTPDRIRQAPASPYAAELVGTNLLRGRATGGRVRVADATLVVADRDVEGPVLVSVHPTAITLSSDRPHGSARNAWRAPVALVERLGDRCRVSVEGPLPLTAEVTPSAVDELGLVTGRVVWASLKATEITVTPDR